MSGVTCPVCGTAFPCSEALKGHIEGEHGYTVYTSGGSTKVQMAELQEKKRGFEGDHLFDTKMLKTMSVAHNTTESEKNFNNSEKDDEGKRTGEEIFIQCSNSHEGRETSNSPASSGDPCQAQPSRFTKDPLRGFFLQTVMECRECRQRPTKKFSTHNAWQLHLKTFHKQIKSIVEYKSLHGDPDLVKFRHRCRECGLDLVLHLGIVKRHLRAQHQLTVATYLTRHRQELEEERRGRPVVPPMHTLDGWWEGCLYCCGICGYTYGGQLAFENHLASVHGLSGQEEVEEKYVSKHGRPRSLLRQHECYVCGRQIRHDYKTIFTHLTKHKMDLESYAIQFRSLLETELKEKGMGYVLERAVKSEGALTLAQWLGQQPKQASIDPLDGWADCSEHLCKLCGETFWSNLRFHWHVKRQHGLPSTKEYRRLHGDPERRLRQHKCQLCGSLIKWEASRIRDHLKFHRETKDKLTIKEYGEKFRDYILEELGKVKSMANSPNTAEKEQTLEKVDSGVGVGLEKKSGVYSGEEWRALQRKKVTPRDRVTCELCHKTMNRHSYTRHKEKAHHGIFNIRDLERLKRKQVGLAKAGVVRTLEQLVAGAGGKMVMQGKGEGKVQVDMKREDLESGLHMYRAGLSIIEIEKKVDLLHSGLTITKAVPTEDEVGELEQDEQEEMVCETAENYPTYIVDENTGEILFVEEVGLEQDGEVEQVSEEIEEETMTPAQDLGRNGENTVVELEQEEAGHKSMPCDESGLEREADLGAEEEDEGGGEEDTGPLDGRVMQLVPHGEEGAEVTIIQLGREEEEVALEEEMLETELGREYVLEDGVLREAGNGETWQQEVTFREEAEEVKEGQAEEFVLHSMDHSGFMLQGDEQPPFIVLQDVGKEEQVTETSQYIQLVDKREEEEQASQFGARPWSELGGGGEYARKIVSKPVLEHGGRVSQGTVIAPWTKMPEARVRVAHSKVVIPSTSFKGEEAEGDRDVDDKDMASTVVYSKEGRIWRDIGSQVAPHRVSGQPSSTEEERGEARRVEDFLARGGQLDRSCPGCGKVMSRQRNLVTHLKVIHGVSVTGKEGEEHESRYSKENVKLECVVCQKRVSRKSLKRHMNLCHPGVQPTDAKLTGPVS